MKKIIYHFIAGLLSFYLTSSVTLACTDFRIKSQDGTLLITRSMEFAADMHANIMSSPRNRTFTTPLPNGKTGLSWKNIYGYVFLDAFDTGFAIDGINEQGLAIEALYLPGITQYPIVPLGKENTAVSYLNFGDWVLGNFKTIEEVKQALDKIIVFAQPYPKLNNMIFPLHYNITDAAGNSIVIEFVSGKMNVYDNVLGVLTNSPSYDWHLTNLRNFINLSPLTPNPVVDNGITFSATGQGAGMVGLPGDISPPSRFVKIATLLKTVFSPKNTEEAVNLSLHLINNVDIPLGFVRESLKINTATNELTQWVVIKDLTHKTLYYRTYYDLNLRFIDMSKIDFNPNAKQLKMPIGSKQTVIDMTKQFTQI